jgi:hypothetical protein
MTTLYPPSRPRLRVPVPLVGLATLTAACGYLALAALLVRSTSFDIWAGLVFAPLLLLATLPMLRRWQRDLGLDWLVPLACTGLVLKFAGGVARWYVVYYMYDGEGDSARYHASGTRHAAEIWAGHLPSVLGRDGTGVMDVLTGYLYAVTGATILGGFMVFAWLGFLGQLLALRAFVEGVPDGNHKRFAALVLLLPSLLFWPSAVGKEAWMLLGIGACMLGAVRLLTRPPAGLVLMVAGLGATALVRPHVTMLVAAAAVTAFAVGRTSGTVGRRTKLVALVVLAGATMVLIRMAADAVGVNDLSVEGVTQAWETRSGNTEVGGSSFSAQPVSGPQDLPMAVVTLILRPFPWEAGGLLPLFASAEGLLIGGLLGLAVLDGRRVLTAVRRNPFVTFCLAYVLAYAVLFSGFSNFAILVRQRTLAMPAFLVLICLSAATHQVTKRSPAATGASMQRPHHGTDLPAGRVPGTTSPIG